MKKVYKLANLVLLRAFVFVAMIVMGTGMSKAAVQVTTTEAKANAWDSQVRYKFPKTLLTGTNYSIAMTVKATSAVEIQPIAVYSTSKNVDDYGGSKDVQYLSATLPTNESVITVNTNGAFPYDYLYLNIGKFSGTMTISNVTVTSSSGTILFEDNISSIANWSKPGWHSHVTYSYEENNVPSGDIHDSYLEVVTTEAKTNPWDSQVKYKFPVALAKGNEYEITITAKATQQFDPQLVAVWEASENRDDWGGTADVQYMGGTIKTDWTEIKCTTNGKTAYDYLNFNIGALEGNLYIAGIKVVDKANGNVVSEDYITSINSWSKVSYHNHVAYSIPDKNHIDFVFTGYDDNDDYMLRPIRQKGKHFVYVDDENTTVTLHGVMDTPNWYFNNDRWPLDWSNPYNNDADVRNCLAYFEKTLSAYTNHKEGSYCDVFRLHLDPKWTNDRNIQATNGGDENDISQFSPDRLRTYMDKLYWPIIEKALAKGLYVIMRPPGVCPQNIQVGGEYQEYLKTVWGIVASDERVQKYAGNIMIELANEPIAVLDKDGTNANNRPSVLHDFFQPIVDVIREKGFKGIVLSSGSGYQSQYGGYKTNPITGDNIGYAVHWYPGWMGTDRSFDNETIRKQFELQVPVVNSRPIVVTEIDWSPADESGQPKKDKEGNIQYNEMGQIMYENYGTWGTGRSDQFGKVFKYSHDYYGNISMTLTHPYEYVDFDQLFINNVVTYSFQKNKEPQQACAYTCFVDWYPTLYTNHWIDGKEPVEENGVGNDLTQDMFFNWTAADASGEKNKNAGCAYELNKSTGMPYGDGNVYYLNYADLSKVDKLYVTATEGEPRFLFNRTEDEGYVNVELPRDKTTYETVVENADGSMTYIVDVKAIVAQYGFAHLHAIKGANFANTTVTAMYYTLDVPTINEDLFDFDDFITSGNATFNRKEHSLTGGDGGWSYANGVDLSAYKYLVITSGQNRNMCKTSVKLFLSFDDKTINGETPDNGQFTEKGKELWLDRWNHNNIIVINLPKLQEAGYDITKLKELKFNFWGDASDVFYINNVYATNTLPNYTDGDHARTISEANRYSTVCLPYHAAYSGCIVYEIAGKKDNELYLQRVENLMEAGKSYLFVSTPNYDGNDVHKAIFYKASNFMAPQPLASNGLVGTFTDNGKVPNNMYIVSSNMLKYVDNVNVNFTANRAYVDYNAVPELNGGTPNNTVKMHVVGESEDTGIAVAADVEGASVVGIYSVSGMKQNTLQKGLNIIRMSDNSVKKVIIK